MLGRLSAVQNASGGKAREFGYKQYGWSFYRFKVVVKDVIFSKI